MQTKGNEHLQERRPPASHTTSCILYRSRPKHQKSANSSHAPAPHHALGVCIAGIGEVWWSVVDHGLINGVGRLVREDAGGQARHQLLHTKLLAQLEDVLLHRDVVCGSRATAGGVEGAQVSGRGRHCWVDVVHRMQQPTEQ